MNSTIQIIGQKKDLMVTQAVAQKIQDILADNKISGEFVIQINGMSFRKSSVRFVEIVKDRTKKEIWDQEMKEFSADEFKQRKILVGKSPEYKASLLDMFSYLYKFSANEFPLAEILEQARCTQLEFFRSHPNRTLCDLYLLKPLIQMKNKKPNIYEHGFFRVVERTVYRDMQLSGQLRSNYQPKVHKPAQFGETPEQAKQRAEENRKTDLEFDEVVKDAVNNF